MTALRTRSGLTLVEIIVSMLILAVLGTTLVTMLPGMTRNTRAASVDTTLSQTVSSVFEVVGASWSNAPAFDANEVDYLGVRYNLVSVSGEPGFVALQTDGQCEAAVSVLSDVPGGAVRKRVLISCDSDGASTAWSMRAEFGDPSE